MIMKNFSEQVLDKGKEIQKKLDEVSVLYDEYNNLIANYKRDV